MCAIFLGVVTVSNRSLEIDTALPKVLQEQHPSLQTRCLNPANCKNKLRHVYMYLDAGVPGLSRNCDERTFRRAVFYVGKGTQNRPFKHLEEARDYLLTRGARRVFVLKDFWTLVDEMTNDYSVVSMCPAKCQYFERQRRPRSHRTSCRHERPRRRRRTLRSSYYFPEGRRSVDFPLLFCMHTS